MKISIGLPDHIPGVDVSALVEWGRRAEARGFSAVFSTDRLNWSTPEPLTVLSAIAGATSTIGLAAGVMVAPLRSNHALSAKSIATLDRIAGPNRLRIGVAPGLRKDDFDASGLDFGARGEQLDILLRRMRQIWCDDTGVGPRPVTPGGPALLFGGASPFTVRRIVEYGGGWIAGGVSLERFTELSKEIRTNWSKAGRGGAPHIINTLNVALGPRARAAVDEVIGSYYAFLGADIVKRMAGAALTSLNEVHAAVERHRQLGCDELVLVANAGDIGQLDQLAAVLTPRQGQ